MNNARKVHSPIMQCTLYGVPKYTLQGKKVKKAKAAAKLKVKAEGSASGKVPASSQRKADAVNDQLNDHVAALDTLITAARSKEVSPFVSSGTSGHDY